MFKKAFQILQQLGRALMTPVAVLPAAGLLLRFGDKDLLNIPIIKDAGGVVFDNLPLIFAVGVAIGLAGGEGVAGLAAVIGYFILTVTLDNMGKLLGLQLLMKEPSTSLIWGYSEASSSGFLPHIYISVFHPSSCIRSLDFSQANGLSRLLLPSVHW